MSNELEILILSGMTADEIEMRGTGAWKTLH